MNDRMNPMNPTDPLDPTGPTDDGLGLAARMDDAAAPVTGAGITREAVDERVAARGRGRALRQRALVAAAAVVIVLIGVGLVAARPEDEATTFAGPGDPASTEAPTSEAPATEGPATTSVVPDDGTTEPDPATTTTAPPSTTTTAPDTTTSVVAPWPAQLFDLVQGGRVWGVYLLAVPTADNGGFVEVENHPTAQAAEALGYDPALGELACDQGAVEGVGLDPSHGWVGATIHFATRAEADAFAERFETETGHSIVGVAEVTTYCLD